MDSKKKILLSIIGFDLTMAFLLSGLLVAVQYKHEMYQAPVPTCPSPARMPHGGYSSYRTGGTMPDGKSVRMSDGDNWSCRNGKVWVTSYLAPRPIYGIPDAGTLILNATPQQLLYDWPNDYNGGNCNAGAGFTPGTYKITGNGTAAYLQEIINGQDSNCAHKTSPAFYHYGVFESKFYIYNDGGHIPDWPAIWMTSIDDPVNTWGTQGYTEIDAYEGNKGTDYVSYWSGDTAQPASGYGAVTGYSTSGKWTSGSATSANFSSSGLLCYPGATPVPSPCGGIGPGWNTVDWVWGPGFINVYDNGVLYAEVPTITSNPMQIVLDVTEGSNGYQPGTPAAFDIQYVRAWNYQG